MTAAAPIAPQETAVSGIRDLITHATWVKGDTTTSAVVDIFEKSKHLDSVAILDQGVLGMVSRLRFFAQIGRKFGYSLYENRPVRLLAEEASVIEGSANPVEAVALATQRQVDRVYDDLFVVEESRFVGIVSMRSLLVHHKNLLSASMAEVQALDARNRELEEMHRLRSDFVARMTHELRSPLNTILGIGRLLLDDPAVASRHGRNVELMFARCRDLLGTIDNILDVSRMQAGAMQPFPEPVDLPALFEDLAHSAAALVAGRPVRVVYAARRLPTDFVTDPSYLRRILSNLLANAAAATDLGEIRLRGVCAHGRLHVQVSDSGRGIPAEALPRLFEPFVQVEASVTRRGGGSGLGLAIVHGLLQALGGRIRVESRVGEGTTFTFDLPQSRLSHQETSS
jgi:signal transduction histidine kinase